jgi:hypothetical protein
LRFHRHRHPVVSTRCSVDWHGLVCKFHKMEIVQTCTGTWRWCMGMYCARFAVFVRRARVLPGPCPATRNLCVLVVSPAPSHCCFHLLFLWDGTGRCENSTRWKSCKRVRVRAHGCGARRCLAHALQCLCDGRACCPALFVQLVICRLLRFHRHRHTVVSTWCFSGMVRVGVKIPQDGNRTNTHGHIFTAPSHCSFISLFTGMVRVGVTRLLKENCIITGSCTFRKVIKDKETNYNTGSSLSTTPSILHVLLSYVLCSKCNNISHTSWCFQYFAKSLGRLFL